MNGRRRWFRLWRRSAFVLHKIYRHPQRVALSDNTDTNVSKATVKNVAQVRRRIFERGLDGLNFWASADVLADY